MEIDFIQYLFKFLNEDLRDFIVVVVLYGEIVQMVIFFYLIGRGVFFDKFKELRIGGLRFKLVEMGRRMDVVLIEVVKKFDVIEKGIRD